MVELKRVLKMEVFQLRKFLSNNSAAVEKIPVQDSELELTAQATRYISKSKVTSIEQMSISKKELEAATSCNDLTGFCETEMTEQKIFN